MHINKKPKKKPSRTTDCVVTIEYPHVNLKLDAYHVLHIKINLKWNKPLKEGAKLSEL